MARNKPGMMKLKDELGIEIALVQGPMGGVAGPRLVSAVADCGALAVLPIWAESPASAADLIAETQGLTAGNFVVNLRADLDQLEHIAVSADLGIRTFHFFGGIRHNPPGQYALSMGAL